MRLPLHYTGQHYLLPLDALGSTVCHLVKPVLPQAAKEPAPPLDSVQVAYPHSKVLTRRDWANLAQRLTTTTGRVVSFDIAGNQIAASETVGIRDSKLNPRENTNSSVSFVLSTTKDLL